MILHATSKRLEGKSDKTESWARPPLTSKPETIRNSLVSADGRAPTSTPKRFHEVPEKEMFSTREILRLLKETKKPKGGVI